MTFKLWKEMVQQHPSVISDYQAETMYHMAAAAWGEGQTWTMRSGGRDIDLTKLFEQYRMLQVLKEKEPNHHGHINSEDC